MFFSLLTILALVIVVYFAIKSVIKPNKYPPGPTWLPFLGSSNVMQEYSKKHGSQFSGLHQLAKEYSTQVLGLKLGNDLVVVVYGEKNLRQVFTEREFEGRPYNYFIKLRCFGKKLGITFVDGALWQEHRQFTMKHLRNAGFGKTAMEKEIQNGMQKILQYIKENNHKPISTKTIIPSVVLNVLWKYAAGEEIDDDKLKLMLDLFKRRSQAFTMAGGLLNQFPWCRHFIPKLSGYSLIVDLNRQISAIIEETIAKHKKKQVEGNDFIYSFLSEMNENKPSYSEEQLKVVCADLLIAGSQTTGNMLEFALLTMLRHKDIQEKVYEEIKSVIGDETPGWNDSSRLFYTSAFMLELQRFYPIVPLMGPRRVLSDTEMDGYRIPKDTTVLLSVGDSHYDTSLWDNPQIFRPERFIDDTGSLKSSEHMYPFGLGRRRCPGDSLARSFVFITLVGIIQNYRIECSNGTLPSPEPLIGLISAPGPFTAEFLPRK